MEEIKIQNSARQRLFWTTVYVFNIQSSFIVQNTRARLVKIEHVILLYLTSANSDSALLKIKYKNRALLTMASADRFAEIVEEQIPKIINEADTHKYQNKKTLRIELQVNWSTLEMQDLKIAILRSLITCQRKAIDLL